MNKIFFYPRGMKLLAHIGKKDNIRYISKLELNTKFDMPK
jgi:hypothetical protein